MPVCGPCCLGSQSRFQVLDEGLCCPWPCSGLPTSPPGLPPRLGVAEGWDVCQWGRLGASLPVALW